MCATNSNNFASFSDEKLAVLAQQGNDKALDFLLNKFRVFVRSKSLSYYIAGADRDDIIQEGRIGLFKAVRDFSQERGVSFKTFADVCVTRQIITAVKNAREIAMASTVFRMRKRPIPENTPETTPKTP